MPLRFGLMCSFVLVVCMAAWAATAQEADSGNLASIVPGDLAVVNIVVAGARVEGVSRPELAMLQLTAGRVEELLRDPAPFALHKPLGDSCVTDELYVSCDRPPQLLRLYRQLHRSISSACGS